MALFPINFRSWLAGGIGPAILLVAFLLSAGPASAVEEQTLSVWGIGIEGKLLGQLVPRFEQEHPGVRVSLLAIPWWAAHEKLITAIIGDMAPDISEVGNTWMSEFVAMDALEPLNPLMAGSGIGEEDFFPGTLESNRVGETWYGLPWYTAPLVVFYRHDLFAAVGCKDFPGTWEEVREACHRMKRQDPTRKPFSVAYSDPLHIAMYLWQHEAAFLAGNGPGIISPSWAVVETLDWLKRWRDEGLTPGMDDTSTELLTGFAAGHYAMFVGGPWQIADLEKFIPEVADRWTTAPLPAARNALSFLGGCNLVLFRNSPRKKLAWEFLAFLSRPEIQEEWFRLSRGLPPVRAAWDRPLLQAEPKLRAFRTQLEHAQSPTFVPEWEQMTDVLYRSVDDLMRGKSTSEAGARTMEEKMRIIFDRSSLWQSPMFRGSLVIAVFALAGLGLAWFFRGLGSPAAQSRSRSHARLAWWFLVPAVIHLAIFRGVPLVGTFLVSLSNWNIYGVADMSRVMFVGLENYRLLWEDPIFWAAVRNTLVFTLLGAPLNILFSLSVALSVNRVAERWQAAFRVGFFLPVITTLVAITLIWRWLYDLKAGPLNQVLAWFGMAPVDWLGQPNMALFCLMLLAVWKGAGYNMVIFLAGRQNIPEELYEASAIDGATSWQQFRHITFPQLRRPMTFAVVVTGIGFLQCFTEPYLITGGGPQDGTMTMVLYLYQNGFKYFRVGYASSIAMALLGGALLLNVAKSWIRRSLEVGR